MEHRALLSVSACLGEIEREVVNCGTFKLSSRSKININEKGNFSFQKNKKQLEGKGWDGTDSARSGDLECHTLGKARLIRFSRATNINTMQLF